MNDQTAALNEPADAKAPAGSVSPPDDSLIEDVRNLVEDGKTYLEAELQYQKSRAALALDRSRSGALLVRREDVSYLPRGALDTGFSLDHALPDDLAPLPG